MNKFIQFLSIFFLYIANAACVGPTTPFGAIDTISPDFRSIDVARPKFLDTNIFLAQSHRVEFYPARQNLHSEEVFSMKIHGIKSPTPVKYLKILYNEIDVTDKVLKNARVQITGRSFEVVFKELALPVDHNHQISVYYSEPGETPLLASYKPPICKINDQQLIVNTKPFTPSSAIISKIEQIAPRHEVNPSFLAGIVAQESAFNPKAVSWAKAIGLTQITPLAESEIITHHSDFQQHPGLNKHPYWQILYLIKTGKVNSQTEWRLDPEKSIQGGVSYLKYLDDYWNKDAHKEILASLSGDSYVNYTKVILASYNSGPARVKYAIKQKKDFWLEYKKLKEAKKYVARIFSYCYHFANTKPQRNAKL